jgi:hypothetical protein
MDDSTLSRRVEKGVVNRYCAVDVVSGYWFKPVYAIRRKLNKEDVIKCFRNMFIEIEEYGLPVPGELDVEHHLMQHIDWLEKVFNHLTFNNTAPSKRAEHAIKSLKWDTAHKNKHTDGRFYGSKGAFKSVKIKMHGDIVKKIYDPQTLIEDDLYDIEEYNNSLHPDQKTHKGMTRKDVLLKKVNPNLIKYEKRMLYNYIGNEMKDITIGTNNIIHLNNGQYALESYDMLDKLKPNNYKVDAYWLPDKNGYVSEAFLYQDGKYIGRVFDYSIWRFNECKAEQTEQDLSNAEEQFKRNAKFDKKLRDRQSVIPKNVFEMMRKDAVMISEIAASEENYRVIETGKLKIENEWAVDCECDVEYERELAYAI